MYVATKGILLENRILLLGSIAALAAFWTFCVPHHASTGVLLWWACLCGVSILNVCGWRYSAVAVERRRGVAEAAEHAFQRRQVLLSGLYVLGCGFRSIVPRADVQRMGLFDHWASSVMVGRSVATVAELCFMLQWALLLNKLAKHSESRFGIVVSWLLVPLIFLAETCSWHAVLTTSYLGNALEESLWTISATLLVVSLILLWPRSVRSHRPFMAVALALGIAYVTFMCAVDVPMYFTRWLADEANGRQYLSLAQGAWDVWSRWIVTVEWEAWRMEIPWMSLYFSVGVWSSIALIHAPQFKPKPAHS